MKGQTYVILAILCIILISVFAVLNMSVVEVNYLFWSGSSPLIFIILFSVLFGGLITMLFGTWKIVQLKRQKRQLNAPLKQLQANTSTNDQTINKQKQLRSQEKKDQWSLNHSRGECILKSKKILIINASNHQDLSILDRILINRGIVSDDEKDRFLLAELQHLTPSANLAQIDQAKNRIVHAIESGEEILIYGDYDADGISSTALMMHTLIELGAQCNYYIPNRFTEGYGLNADVFPTFKEKNIGLIITV